MSRIFFVSANVTNEPYPVYPLGMAVCSAALNKKGHDILQFDFLVSGRSEQKLRESLKEFDPDYICFSIRNIDNADSFSSDDQWYLDDYKLLLDLIRKDCRACLILGGSGFSIMPEKILTYLGGDYGIKGEGERALVELVQKLENGEKPPQIMSTCNSPLESEEMLSPLYQKDLVNFYLDKSTIMNIQTKRGCPYHCSYCTYPYLEGKEFRSREAKSVVDDIERLQQDYNAHDFVFTDSVFNDPRGHHLEVVEEIIRRGLKIRWGSFFTPRKLDIKELSLMKRSGLKAVELGTDAGCDRTLEGLRKEFSFSDVINFTNACVKNEIPCCHFIMFGGPNESEDTIKESVKNIMNLEQCVVFCFSGIRILPGTELYLQALKEGIVKKDESLLKPKYYFSPDVEKNRMNEILVSSFKEKRKKIFAPGESRVKLAVLKNFDLKGILWDKLIRFSKK